MQIIEELTAEGILNDFVRIADESRTSTAVIDPTNSQQTEINEYGPSVQPGRAGRAGRQDPLPLQGRGRLRPRRVAAAGRALRLLRGPAARAAPGEDGDGGRRRRGPPCAPRWRPSRASSARTCARPRRSSATSSATRRTWPPAWPPWPRWAPRRPSSTTRTAASPTSAPPRGKRGHTYAARLPAAHRRGLDGRLGRRLPRRLPVGALRPPARRGVPGARGGLRRRQHPALRRRRASTRPTSSR